MLRLSLALVALLVPAAQDAAPPAYETREKHDPNGINKWYLGREIAHVMGPGGIPWLDRPERENEENPAKCIEALRLRKGDVVADLGAGSGFYSFRMSREVGPTGKILAVEIQDEMIAELKKRIARNSISNVETIKCTERDPRLPDAGVDLVIMVDVYHELAFPYEVMSAVRKALKPGGRVALVEFRKEDKSVPIKDVHKMTEEQIGKEMAAVGLKHLETLGILPWQHVAIYTNRDVDADAGIDLGFRMRLPDELQAQRAQMSRDAEYVVRKRLAAAGIEGGLVQLGEGTLRVRLPGATPETASRTKAVCAVRGDLQLRPVASLALQVQFNRDKIVPEGYAVVDNPSPRLGEYEAFGAKLLVQKVPVIEGRHIVHAEPKEELTPEGSRWVTTVELSEDGAKRFDHTAEWLYAMKPPGLLAILLDGVLRSAPALQSPAFHGRVMISGAKDREEAATLALILSSGALPAPLELEAERSFGPKK